MIEAVNSDADFCLDMRRRYAITGPRRRQNPAHIRRQQTVELGLNNAVAFARGCLQSSAVQDCDVSASCVSSRSVSEADEHLSKRVRNISDRVVGVNALRER